MTAAAFFLRLGRWGVIGFAAIGFTATFVQSNAFYAVAGRTAASQATFGASMSAIAGRFTAVFPPPVHPETVGGYVWWRGYQAVAIVFAVWALASATAMVRSDERRGMIEAVLATGTSRIRLVAARAAAFLVAVAVASASVALGFIAVVHEADALSLFEASLLVASLTLSCYGIALLVAQLSAGRMATAAAAVVLLSLFLANSLSRVFPSLSTVRWLSPFRYYELNQPLVSGGAFDSRTVGVLLGIALLTVAGAAAGFVRRDLGSPLVTPPAWSHAISREPSILPVWRIPLVRELYERRLGVSIWCAGMVGLAIVFAAITKTLIQPLLSLPTLVPYFGAVVRSSLYPTLLGYVWFNFAQLLFAGFAITQVARWAAEDVDGRLEMVLSQPRFRAAVVMERLATATVAACVIAAVSGTAVFYASRAQGIELDADRLTTATLLLVPFALDFAAAGSLLAAWKPRAAVGLLGGAAFLGYLDTEVGALLKFPAWVQDLSPFKLYGTPLVSGLDARSLAIMLLIAVAAAGSSILVFGVRDVRA